MTRFLANHSMENFFINPTMTYDTSMETFARISIMNEPSPPPSKTSFDDFPLSEGSNKEEKLRRKSTIQELFLSHNFLNSYHSEEELASPRDSSDSLSLRSDDIDPLESPLADFDDGKAEPSALDLFLVPEELANSCAKIDDRCNRAQAITLKPVGKPRMVSMPKMVDIRPVHHKRVSEESLKARPISVRRADSRKSTKSTASTKVAFEHPEPVPAIPVSVLPTPDEVSLKDVVQELESPVDTTQRKPSVPLIRAANAFDPFPKLSDIAAGTSRKDMAIKRSITVSGVPESPSSPMSPAKRRLHRLASTISSASDLVRRKSSVSSLRKPLSITASPRPSMVFDQDSPQTPMGPIPKRRSSMGKLTPRGPTERAPILVLPPFPDDDEEDDDFGDASSDQALAKWDRPRARQAAMHGKQRPSIDGVVAGSA